MKTLSKELTKWRLDVDYMIKVLLAIGITLLVFGIAIMAVS